MEENESEKETRARKKRERERNESEREDKDDRTNGSGEWHGIVQDGAGNGTVGNTVRTGDPPMANHPTNGAAPVVCPKRGEDPAFVTSQLSLASYAVVIWHRNGKAGQ
jgi:hypothetical protein